MTLNLFFLLGRGKHVVVAGKITQSCSELTKACDSDIGGNGDDGHEMIVVIVKNNQ